MKALIQRVEYCRLHVDGTCVSSIDKGLFILLGIGQNDSQHEADLLWKKISKLRIFEDEQGKTNLDLASAEGSVLIASQFTLYASCKKGNRPSFTQAAPPKQAEELYEYFLNLAQSGPWRLAKGVFGAHMKIELLNDGPFTIMLDSDDFIS